MRHHTARPTSIFVLLFLPLVLAAGLDAQQPDRPLQVFLDCNDLYCDTDFYVQELPWIRFVRDRQDADVHALVTAQPTGGGGRSVGAEFIGREGLTDQRIHLTETIPADATEFEARDALADLLMAGLAPFARGRPGAPQVQITAEVAEQAEVQADAPRDDPWNSWVFSFGINGFTNGESRQQFLTGSGSVSAARVTELWKLELSARGSRNMSRFEINDTLTQEFNRESYSATALAVRSIGGRWAAGGVVDWSRSTFANYDTSLRFGPAIEYNIFPYSESARQLLTVLYSAGSQINDYDEVTIFGAAEETLLEQMLLVSYDVTQPWGQIDASARGTHFVTRLDGDTSWEDPQYNLGLNGGLNVRLFRGLSANFHGSAQMIRGQIHLRAGELTEEEIIAQQRELATDYRYFLSFGLRYRFGSIFSDVVNPRFEGL